MPLDDLQEYLGVFSDVGSLPTSLQGYGFGSARHYAELRGLGAQQTQTDDPAGPRPSPNKLKIGTDRWNQLRAMKISDVRWGLNQIGIKAGTSTTFDSNLPLGWARYVGGFKRLDNGLSYFPDFYPAEGGFDSAHWVWANTYALADLGTRAKKAASTAPSAKTASNVSKPALMPAPSPAPNPAGNAFVTSVASVQDILVRLGWKGKLTTTGALSKDLTDGLFGSATVANWQQSANKRKLDPKIARDSATTVAVSQATFLALKSLADQMVPPTTNQPVVPAPSGTTTIPEARLNEVITRLAGSPPGTVATYAQLVTTYQQGAKTNGLDTSISKNAQGGVVVNTKTWNTFVDAYNKLPAPVPGDNKASLPPQKQSALDQAKAQILKASDTSLPAETLRDFLNIAINQGTLKHEPFRGDTWSTDYVPLIVRMLQVSGDAQTAWEQLLVVGQLVSKDKKSVKLPANQVAAIKKDVAAYKAQQKQATTAPKDFTKVDTSKVIGWVNDLNIVSKKFNTSGGATEMSDALRTFLDNTKTSAPSTIVWGDDKTGIYVQNGVLAALKKATDANKASSASTQAFRAKIVTDALNASTESVGMQPLQLSFIETVSAKKAGKDEKVYAKVKQTDTFDGPTRDAYTALARTLIIGPAFDQYQQMLKKQMGTAFTTKFAEQEYNKIWDEYLKQAIFQRQGAYASQYDNSKTAIKTVPVLANQIRAAAKARMDREGSKKVADDEKAQAKKDLAAAIAKSSSIMAVIDAQLGLLWAIEKKSTKFARGIKATGIADSALGSGMKDFSKAVFDRDPIPDKLWNEYLEATGIKATSGGNVTFGWTGANFIAVPSATATTLSKAATSWMTKHGVPDGYKGLTSINPLNQATLARFTKATVVKVEVPSKKPSGGQLPSKDEQKKLEDEAKRLKDQATKDKKATDKAKAEAARLKKEAADAKKRAAQDAANKKLQDDSAAADARARAAEQQAIDLAAQLAKAQQDAARAAQQAQSAGGAGGASAGGSGGSSNVTINVPDQSGGGGSATVLPPPAPAPDIPLPAPAPDIAPPAPTPDVPSPEPVQASMMSPGAWLLMSAVGLGVLFHEQGKGKQGRADNQQRTRYSRKRGGRK
jgi:type II secretory pathway pseudopilin PulG